jgi:hypothetical protein
MREQGNEMNSRRCLSAKAEVQHKRASVEPMEVGVGIHGPRK